MEFDDCGKVTLSERQRHQSSWITNRKKITRATDTAIAPNRITLQHYRKHSDKIESKCRIVQSQWFTLLKIPISPFIRYRRALYMPKQKKP